MERLIYRLDQGPVALKLPETCTFVSSRGRLLPWPLLARLVRRYGLVRGIKALLKVATPSRRYYGVVEGRDIVSDGWILLGKCNVYPIARDACVIGPIWTSESQRGRGLAASALSQAVRQCLDDGLTAVYIDTSGQNIASQKAIGAAGFRLLDVV